MSVIDVRNKPVLTKIEEWFKIKAGTVKNVIIAPYPQKEGAIVHWVDGAELTVYVNDDIEYNALRLIYNPMRNECVLKEHRDKWYKSREYQDDFVHNQYWWHDYYRQKYRDCIFKNALKLLDPELYEKMFVAKPEITKEVKPVEKPTEKPEIKPTEKPEIVVTKDRIIQILDEVMPLIISKATGKSFKQSKTIWTNLLAFLIFIWTQIWAGLPPETKITILKWFGPLLALINIWLRFKTYQPIKLSLK